MLKRGQFGKRRLKLFGVLIMGFSFFFLKFIGNIVRAVCKQAKPISSMLLTLTNRCRGFQHVSKTKKEVEAEGK
jgi:hypothetical protein